MRVLSTFSIARSCKGTLMLPGNKITVSQEENWMWAQACNDCVLRLVFFSCYLGVLYCFSWYHLFPSLFLHLHSFTFMCRWVHMCFLKSCAIQLAMSKIIPRFTRDTDLYWYFKKESSYEFFSGCWGILGKCVLVHLFTSSWSLLLVWKPKNLEIS